MPALGGTGAVVGAEQRVQRLQGNHVQGVGKIGLLLVCIMGFCSGTGDFFSFSNQRKAIELLKALEYKSCEEQLAELGFF